MTTIVSQPKETRKLGVHQQHEVLLKLENAGLDEILGQRLIDSKNNELAQKVVRLIENGGFEPTTSQKLARQIMGKNFFGIEEATKHFGANLSKSQLAALAEVPFSEAELTAKKDTHVLVAVVPMSILDIRGKVETKLFYNQDWYNKEVFAKERGEVGWHLVCKTPVPDSTSKNWDEQQALIDPKTDETPSARVLCYTIIGHFLSTGERLFEKVYVRTSSVDSDGRRVLLGSFAADGLRVGNYWDDDRDGDLGLSSARKQ